MSPPRTARDELGFTLVELMMAIAISLIITGVLATSIVVGLRNADSAGQRLANSHDAQISQSYFTSDGTSADLLDVDSTDDTCPGAAGDSLLIRFRWTVPPADPTDADTYQVAAYRIRTAGTERQLVRQYCSGTASFASVSAQSTLVLAHGLNSAVPPTVACTAKTTSICSSVSAFNPFTSVTVTGSSIQTSSESNDTLSFTLKATRRSTQ